MEAKMALGSQEGVEWQEGEEPRVGRRVAGKRQRQNRTEETEQRRGDQGHRRASGIQQDVQEDIEWL